MNFNKRKLFSNLLKSCLVLAFIVFKSSTTSAQNERFEKTSFDTDDKIYSIDAVTEKRIGLFPDINNFKQAEAYISDKQYMVDIQTTTSANHIKMYLKDDEFLQIQKKVDNYMQSKSVAVKNQPIKTSTPVVAASPNIYSKPQSNNPSGRGKLRRSAAALAYGVYGWMLPIGIGAFDQRQGDYADQQLTRAFTSVTGSYVLMTGAGILIPYFVTSNTDISMGAATLYGGASTVGLFHGALLYLTLDGDYNKPRYVDGVFLASIGTSIAEGIAGFSYAKSHNLTQAQSKMISSNGLWALGAGASVAELFSLFKDESSSPYGFATTLAISGGGYILGNSLSQHYNCTLGDARVYNTIVPLTMFTGFSTVLAFGESTVNPKTLATVGVISYGLGIALGSSAIKETDFTNKKANIIIGGTFGGALLGLGGNMLFNVARNSNSTTYNNGTQAPTSDSYFPAFNFDRRTPLFVAVGALGGFSLAYILQQNKTNDTKGSTGMLNVDFSPIMVPRTSFSNDKIVPGMKLNYTF